MGNSHSVNNDTLNWNDVNTDNVSLTGGFVDENLNYLFDKLQISKEEYENNFSENQLSEIYNQIFNQMKGGSKKSDTSVEINKSPQTSSTSSISDNSESLDKYMSSSSHGGSDKSTSEKSESHKSKSENSNSNRTSSISDLKSEDVPSLNTSDLELVDPSK